MNKYSDKSAFEINKAVAVSIGKRVQPDECQVWDHAGFSEVVLSDGGSKDYCNNPSDAWPIILKNEININFRESVKSGVMAEKSGWSEIYSINKNPLRAAMEVFLMMKDTENES